MRHESFDKFILAPMITAIIAIVCWSLVNVVELKEDMATVKTDVKHISKIVDHIQHEIKTLAKNPSENVDDVARN